MFFHPSSAVSACNARTGCMQIMGNCSRISLWDVMIVWDASFLSSFHKHIIPRVQANSNEKQNTGNSQFFCQGTSCNSIRLQKKGLILHNLNLWNCNCHTQSVCECSPSKMYIFLIINTAKSTSDSFRLSPLRCTKSSRLKAKGYIQILLTHTDRIKEGSGKALSFPIPERRLWGFVSISSLSHCTWRLILHHSQRNSCFKYLFNIFGERM